MNATHLIAQATPAAEGIALWLGGTYIILAIAVPVMIALLLLVAFIMMIGVYGVQDRLNEIKAQLNMLLDKATTPVANLTEAASSNESTAEADGEETRQKITKRRITSLMILFGVTLIVAIILAILYIAITSQ